MPTRLQIASKDIFQAVESAGKIFSRADIGRLLSDNSAFWRLAQSTTLDKFIEFLKTKGRLVEFSFELPFRPTKRFVWGDAPTEAIVQSLRPDGYFSHLTAISAHQITDQIPSTIYLNSEQRLGSGGGQLNQRSIDLAFKSKPRISSNSTTFRNLTIRVLNGGNTNNLGVVEISLDKMHNIRVTDLERTLIDAAVRPSYSGGVSQVAIAYQMSHERVSVNRIAAYLRQLAYTYPYHQAIGYYLDRAGIYTSSQIQLLRQFPIEYDFYLTHAMQETKYVPEWRLYVPKGF